MALPILLVCPVPVTPDGRSMTEGGEPIDLADRPERCAVWAHWMIGAQVCCDVHAAIGCDLMGIDFDGLVREAGRTVEDARKPWSERKRSSQEDAARTDRSMHAR